MISVFFGYAIPLKGFVCLDFSFGFFSQGSRKIVYKGLVKDCLSLMCDLSQLTVFSEETGYLKNSSGKQHHEIDYAMALALPEVKKCTCTVLKTLLVMVNSLAILL